MRNIFFLLFFLCVLSSTASADCSAGYNDPKYCINGNCTDGYGTRDSPGGTYTGEFKNCEFHGWGTNIGKDILEGDDYIGEHKNGLQDGPGVNYVSDIIISAIWEEHWPLKDIDLHESICISGNCMNGYGTQINLGAEIKYVGEFKAGLFNGQGTLIFKKGTRYIGEFKDALINGQGIVTYTDGSIYSGEWKLHQKHGLGTFVFADGTTVVAMWDNDDPIKLIGNENSSTSNSSNSQSLTISEGPSTSVSEWLSIAQQGFDMMSGNSSSESSASHHCFKTGEIKQAFNKICEYKCGLTTYTHNLGTGVGLCPSTIQR